MADFQNAGYRLLSFKYTPPPAEKRQAADDDKAGHGSTSQPEGEELPSLSSLLTSLQELEGLDDDGIKETDSIVELREKDKQSPPKTTPLNKFHLFNDLPTEIRLKIWALTFLPRVVEVRPPRPPRPEHSQGQVSTMWKLGRQNHAVCLLYCPSAPRLTSSNSGNLGAATPPPSPSPSKRAKQPSSTSGSHFLWQPSPSPQTRAEPSSTPSTPSLFTRCPPLTGGCP